MPSTMMSRNTNAKFVPSCWSPKIPRADGIMSVVITADYYALTHTKEACT